MDETASDYAVFADFLPDLVVGLVGIPVAFALQEVTQELAKNGSLLSLRAIIALIFLVGAYGLFSSGLLLTLNVGLREPLLALDWQKYATWHILFYVPMTVVFIAVITCFGFSFGNMGSKYPASAVVFDPAGLQIIGVMVVVLGFLPMVWNDRMLRFLWSSYSSTLMIILILFSVFTICSVEEMIVRSLG